MIDLWSSRRDCFKECTYWAQMNYEDIVPINEMVHESVPTGHFFAKEVNSYTTEVQVSTESFMAEKNNITIMTRDDVEGLKQNDLVEYEDELWRVENVQREFRHNQEQFLAKRITTTTYIALRR